MLDFGLALVKFLVDSPTNGNLQKYELRIPKDEFKSSAPYGANCVNIKQLGKAASPGIEKSSVTVFGNNTQIAIYGAG